MTDKNEEKIEHIHSDECECNECECGHHHLEECHCSECDSEENYDEESVEKYDADGIDNKEHLLDLFEEAEMLYDNIKDNTDSAFEVLKSLEGKEDEDVLDVLRINCSEILEVEKKTKDIYENIKKIEISLKENLELLSDKKIDLIEEYFVALQQCEAVSYASYQKFFTKLNKR